MALRTHSSLSKRHERKMLRGGDAPDVCGGLKKEDGEEEERKRGIHSVCRHDVGKSTAEPGIANLIG